MTISTKYQKMMMPAKHSSRCKRSLDSIKDLVEVVAAASAVVVVNDNNNSQRRKVMTITKSLVSREMPPKKKLKRSLRKWQSNTIQIKTLTIPKEPRRNFRKLLMLMKL